MPAEEPFEDRERRLSEGDQNAADADQGHSDLDQSAADIDQTSSDRDQLASDRDQRAADIDQAASDRAEQAGAGSLDYESTRRTRSQTTHERDASSEARSTTAHIRDATAERRDAAADLRDAAADERDAAAAALDLEIELLERSGSTGPDGSATGLGILIRAARERRQAAEARARAAAHRKQAAADRAMAQMDRRRAAEDRRAAAAELASESTDHLTGAWRRRSGMEAMQHELDRTARTGEDLVVAFVDVDGLKVVNDTRGHAAGDELLRDVVASIKTGLRPYDIVLRYGGDEFVCSLTGEAMAGIGERFASISEEIDKRQPGAAISFGLAQSAAGQTLPELIASADAAMIEARARRRASGARPSSN